MPPRPNPEYSDSSEDEGVDDFTATNVLLGYATTEETDDKFSHLGGEPVCLCLHPFL